MLEFGRVIDLRPDNYHGFLRVIKDGEFTGERLFFGFNTRRYVKLTGGGNIAFTRQIGELPFAYTAIGDLIAFERKDGPRGSKARLWTSLEAYLRLLCPVNAGYFAAIAPTEVSGKINALPAESLPRVIVCEPGGPLATVTAPDEAVPFVFLQWDPVGNEGGDQKDKTAGGLGEWRVVPGPRSHPDHPPAIGS